jgi:hypothetical protein
MSEQRLLATSGQILMAAHVDPVQPLSELEPDLLVHRPDVKGVAGLQGTHTPRPWSCDYDASKKSRPSSVIELRARSFGEFNHDQHGEH